MRTLSGTWTDPFPETHVASLDGAPDRVLVGGRVGYGPRIHEGRVDQGKLVFGTPFEMPTYSARTIAASVACDTLGSEAVAVGLVDTDFTGTDGMLVFPRLGEAPIHIASETESDMRFGDPHVLRGGELFVSQADDGIIHHYRGSARAGFERSTIAVADHRSELAGFALFEDGLALVVAVQTGAPWELHFFVRGAAFGPFVRTRKMPIHAMAVGAHPFGDAVIVTFLEPSPAGAGIVAYDREGNVLRTSPGVPDTRRLSVQGSAISDRFLAVHHKDAVYVMDLARFEPVASLDLGPPRADGEARYPRAVITGTHAVVAMQRGVGLFDLSPLAPQARVRIG